MCSKSNECCATLLPRALLAALLIGAKGFVGTNPPQTRSRSIFENTPVVSNDVEPLNTQLDDGFIRKGFENVDNTSSSRKEADALGGSSSTLWTARAANQKELFRFPMSLFVDQHLIKKALMLTAVNQRIGGVVISGLSGTGKSTLARTMERLMPENIQREKEEKPCAGFLENFPASLPDSGEETELVPTPHITVPLNVMEDSLIGSVDIEESLKAGAPVFSPGLLAKAHQGVLYIDDVNLLEEEATLLIMNVLADGYVQVEREGMSLKYPCRPLLVATFNPQEGEVRDHLLDRVGISLPASARNMKVSERVQVVENVELFMDKTSIDDSSVIQKILDEEQSLRDKISDARKLLPKVQIAHDQILYLCEEATRADCEGHRAEIFATEIAKASAALDGRARVNAQDLQTAVHLAIVPRGRGTNEAQPEQSPSSSQTPPPPPSQENPPESQQEDTQEDMESEDDTVPDLDTTSDPLHVPQEFMFGIDAIPLDPNLIHLQKLARRGAGGKGSRLFNLKRGRFVKSIFPKAGAGKGRIAVGATLRAAAPYQLVRRKRAKEIMDEKEKLVFIRKDDFRIQRLVRKAGVLVIFVVDASGSMALNRMSAAKGAAMSLLQEAYKCRDKICMIAFHGSRAEIVVPPTRSLALTKRRLEGMPCGGGSPLTHALVEAMRVGTSAINVKKDVSRAIIVLLTDGRANVPMYISMNEKQPPDSAIDAKKGGISRTYLTDEALAVARKIGEAANIDFLCIDTEDTFVATGIAEKICRTAQGTYHHLAITGSTQVANITRQGLREIRAV
jgi:magnesium chelatase subunit D